MNDALVDEYYNRLSPGSDWTDTDILVAKEIIRQFLAVAVNQENAHTGMLYKVDKDANLNQYKDSNTGEIIKIRDSGYVSARYEEGVQLYVMFTGLKTDVERVSFPRSVQKNVVYEGLSIMCPEIEAEDIWKDSDTGKAYYLFPVKTVSAVKLVPLVSGFRLFELDENSPEYNLS